MPDRSPPAKQLENIRHARIELSPAATGLSQLRIQLSSPLKIMMAVVALVLLIACANIANLLLARATARRRELAIRMSIGADRFRLVRQLLVESGLLGLIGAGFGALFAWGASTLLLAMFFAELHPAPIRVTPDAQVLGFTLGITMLTVFLFGTAPAFYSTRLELAPSLKEGRGFATAPRRNRLSHSLIIGQVCLSLMLLAIAGLFLRSLMNLMNEETGFDKQNVFVMSVDPGAAGYQVDARLETMMERVEERVGSLPGIHGASFAFLVFGGGWTDPIILPGRPKADNDPELDHNIVGPRYVEVMKTPIVLGRKLSARDTAACRRVAVINQTAARAYFPGSSPIGRTFSIGDSPEWQNIEVVGVAKDAKYMNLKERHRAAAFYPRSQHGMFLYNFIARYTGNLKSIVSEIKGAVRAIDLNLPVTDVTTLAQLVDDSVLNQRLVAQLCTFFGILAVLLACIGIYGVVSYGIARRTNEFGIRVALGAERRHVLWMVLRETLRLVLIGVALGLGVALAASRLVQTELFGLKSYDPLAVVVALTAMIVAASFACYFPARRATGIDPVVALRHSNAASQNKIEGRYAPRGSL